MSEKLPENQGRPNRRSPLSRRPNSISQVEQAVEWLKNNPGHTQAEAEVAVGGSFSRRDRAALRKRAQRLREKGLPVAKGRAGRRTGSGNTRSPSEKSARINEAVRLMIDEGKSIKDALRDSQATETGVRTRLLGMGYRVREGLAIKNK